MKTIDEVIKAYEICMSDESKTTNCSGCPYADEEGEPKCYGDDKEDALHYLKEYKDAYGNVIASMNYHLRKIHELEQNVPLTWDELKQMEGKPVWWETYDPIDEKTGWHNAYWRLIEFINDEHIYVRDSDGEQDCFYKSESEYWQAYRKERE